MVRSPLSATKIYTFIFHFRDFFRDFLRDFFLYFFGDFFRDFFGDFLGDFFRDFFGDLVCGLKEIVQMSKNVVEGDSNNRSYYYCSFSVVCSSSPAYGAR